MLREPNWADEQWRAAPWTRWLLDAWRQVSAHDDIAACCDSLWPGLSAQVPLTRLWIRRVEGTHGWLETVAVAPWDRRLAEQPSRTVVSAVDLAALQRWARRGVVDEAPASVASLIHPSATVPWVAGGLVDEGGEVVGVAVFEGRVAPPSRALLAAMLGPLRVALHNDQRIHELARLREAVEADNRALLARLARDGIAGAVVGADSGMREVMTRVARVGPTDAPVLLLGETGTGKELMARELHERSARAKGPFLKINCGGIPADLIDSELFGHERGSFTGAVAERRGWFERADGGTLFLDEVGELSPPAQVRLLRVLQDGTFERVGGSRPLHADVRVVAATHRDLREMVGDGRFREDLWYRIGVFPIRLPPLRERMGDLPALARHFAARSGERLSGRPIAVRDDDLHLLAAYGWPGNVRELAAVVERSAILGDGQRLDVRTALGVQAEAAPARGEPSGPQRSTGLVPLDQVQHDAIAAALRQSAGKIEGPGGAAARLGIKPSTLRSRMGRLGLSWSAFRPGAST